MHTKLRGFVSDLIPPIVLRGARAANRRARTATSPSDQTREKGPEFYDATFDNDDSWRKHYSTSEYYFLWSVIADRIVRIGYSSILEIGCGAGQLACLLRDKGIRKYHGFDFSSHRVEGAKAACPEFEFSQQDAYQTDLFETCDYEAVICTEFLEHVDRDVEVIKRIRTESHFYGTVPNFPFTSHVRHFANTDEVSARYAGPLGSLRVDAFAADAHGKTFYLLDGIAA